MKKTANKTVFEDIKKVFEESISSQEFKEENEREHRGSKSKKDLPPLSVDVERLRVKFKWMKDTINGVNIRIASRKVVASVQ